MSDMEITVNACGFEVSVADLVTAIETHNNDIAAHPALGGSGSSDRLAREILPTNQVIWLMPNLILLPHLSEFYVNGQRQAYAVDYQIDGLTVTWLGYPLRSHWHIEFFYYF